MTRFGNFAAQEKLKPAWSELNPDVLELVLSKLPEASVIRASNVCKRWYSVTQAPTFVDRYKRNNQEPQGAVFSVDSRKFSLVVLSYGRLSVQRVSKYYATPGVSHLEDSIDTNVPIYGIGGLCHYFTGDLQIELRYKTSLLEKNWRRTSHLLNAVEDPIVGAIRRTNAQNDTFHMVVVAGGLPMEFLHEEYDDLMVSVFDERSDSWTRCEPLPLEFRGCSCSVFMASFVHDGKFYAYNMYSGYVSRLDLDSKKWSKVTILQTSLEMKKLFLVSRSENVFLVGVQDFGQRDLRFNVWELHVGSENIQVGKLVDRCVLQNVRPPPPSRLERWASAWLTPIVRIVAIGVILVIYLIMSIETVARRFGLNLLSLFNPANVHSGRERSRSFEFRFFNWIPLFAASLHNSRNALRNTSS